MESESKLQTCFGGDITYTKYYDVLKNASVVNFKRNKDLVEITEHVGELQIQHGKDMYQEITQLNMVDTLTIDRLVRMNDMIGNPYHHKIAPGIQECSPNSIKYVYYGLLAIRDILQKKLQDIEFVEIGGGYGGQCIILKELFKMFGIHIKKYVMIDLDNVVKFQEKYVRAFQMQHDCVFVPYETHKEYNFHEQSYLFSSYCLSELSDSVRNEYYETIVKNIPHGLVIWNNPFCIDLPKGYKEIPHSCKDIVGKFLCF